MFNEESLFGEESEAQILEMISQEDEYVWEIRETALIAVTNKIARDEELFEQFRFNETYRTLYKLYAYGRGYHQTTPDEYRKLNRAYTFFRAQLAREGRLVENMDLFIE